MRVVPAKRSVAIALLVVVLAIGSGVASAFFSTKGAGSAAAAVRTLSAPTLSTPTPGGGTVSLTWSAVSPPGTGSVTYYVTRDGGEPEGSCPTSEAPTSVLTCVDSGVEVGTHTFKVTAEWSSWTAKSAAKTATVTSGAATHFTLVAASTTPTVAVADNLTITALDAEERTVTSYTGSHSITFTGAQKSPGGTAPTVANSSGGATAFGSATALNFNSGVAAVSSSSNGVMKLYDAGGTSISAGDGTISTATPLAVTVAATTATRLAFSDVDLSQGVASEPCLFTCTVTGLGNSGTIKAGISVTDAYGNTVSGVGTGHTVAVTTSAGTISGGSLTIGSTGLAESTTEFTFTAQSSGAFTDKITAAKSAGTSYTSATLEASK
jgi:hypothetical protein